MQITPLRAHHCKICGRCILRMDHHCPLLQVCIHHHNHKFFLLFLFWPCCLGIFVTLITTPYTIRTANSLWNGGTLSSEQHLLNSAIMNAVGNVLRYKLNPPIRELGNSRKLGNNINSYSSIYLNPRWSSSDSSGVAQWVLLARVQPTLSSTIRRTRRHL
uniref:Palmitoyltransferase n=1 Tax=Angiostrongylus cantonensis TaxID=6313 RepID=A0A0K0DE36_ANGCA